MVCACRISDDSTKRSPKQSALFNSTHFFRGLTCITGGCSFLAASTIARPRSWRKHSTFTLTYAAAHEYFGDVCAKRGMAHEAITHWCSALNLNGRTEDARVLEQTFKAAGFDAAVRTLGERQLEELDAKRARGEYVAAAHYVFLHLKRGKLEDALALLPKMAEEPDWFALQMRVNPILDPLRSDPRFDRITGSLALKN